MSNVKRKLSLNSLSKEKLKKIGSKFDHPITSIENLSNDLFFEICDYLDGCEIYAAFLNLNHHFQQLLKSSLLLFKIKSTKSSIFLNNWKQMICDNKQQIFSIDLCKLLHTDSTSFPIDSSYDHLESLIFNDIDGNALLSILEKLSSLPRLFSLTIDMFNSLTNLTNIYSIILKLPRLKYYQLSTDAKNLSLPSSIEQSSSIEHLVVKHRCTCNELSTIISYMPKLRCLNLPYLLEDIPRLVMITSTTLLNLTHLSIHIRHITFDEFEIFIKKINSKLKYLRIIRSNDITFLNAHRWEKLILQYLFQLKTFYFEYSEHADNRQKYPIYSGELDQFTSTFWMERQWILEAEIADVHIMYSIRPYKYIEKNIFYEKQYPISLIKRWYDDKIFNSSIELSKSTRLNLVYAIIDKHGQVVSIGINRLLTVGHIYHLEIEEEKIYFATLMQTIHLLPELDTLKIHSLIFDQSRNLRAEQILSFCSTKITNKITKVYIEKINHIKEIYFLIVLCPYMKYLKVKYINSMNIESYLRDILMKINYDHNEHLRLLCFYIPTADDHTIKNLEKMINSEKLIINYSIKRIVDNIYLKWT